MTEINKSMDGKVCLVTGATRGLGQETALGLARLGAKVVIVGRNPARIENTLALLRRETSSGQVEGMLADLSCQAEVCRVADDLLSRYHHLDVLVNNVGGTFLRYQESVDGHEMTWALNYLGHFLLTHLLLDALKLAAVQNGEARIVELTSSVYRWSSPNFDRMPKGEGIQGVLAYSKSKRAAIVFSVELSRRLQGTGVTINAVTPGLVKSEIAKDNGWPIALLMRMINLFALPTGRGARPVVRLAADPALFGKSGRFFYQDKDMPDDPTCIDRAKAARLWQLSEQMTRLSGSRDLSA